MAGILKRTAFVDQYDGILRPHEFNIVLTEIGTCIEPSFAILPRTTFRSSAEAYDPTDQIARVDEIKFFSIDKPYQLLGESVHGGTLIPRQGR